MTNLTGCQFLISCFRNCSRDEVVPFLYETRTKTQKHPVKDILMKQLFVKNLFHIITFFWKKIYVIEHIEYIQKKTIQVENLRSFSECRVYNTLGNRIEFLENRILPLTIVHQRSLALVIAQRQIGQNYCLPSKTLIFLNIKK